MEGKYTCTIRSIECDRYRLAGAIRRLYTRMRRNGSSSSLVHPVWPTRDDGWTFTPSEGNASSRDIESRFGAALSPRRHIWAVFFGTGCLIWYRREPLCEARPRLTAYRSRGTNGCDSFFILSVQVAILRELVDRQENITLHGRAIRFFCRLRSPRAKGLWKSPSISYRSFVIQLLL